MQATVCADAVPVLSSAVRPSQAHSQRLYCFVTQNIVKTVPQIGLLCIQLGVDSFTEDDTNKLIQQNVSEFHFYLV